MHLYTWKTILRRLAVVIATLCLVFIYFAFNNNKTVVTSQGVVGVLIPFTPSIDHFNELRAAIKEYPCKIYRNDKQVAKIHDATSNTRKTTKNVESFKIFKDSVINLADKAVNNGTDYLVLFIDDLTLHTTTIDQIKYSVRALKHQIVSDVGIVITHITYEREPKPYFITVHKSHREIFQKFFPDNLNSSPSALKWVENIYKPYLIIEQSVNRPYENMPLSIPFHFGSSFKGGDLIKDRNKVNDFIISKHSVSIISYSLFGSDSRYIDGAIANSKLFKVIYPGWKLWIYHDNTVPLDVLGTICIVDNITCINMTDSLLPNRMSWRFLVASVPFVSRYIIRDIDSRLSKRERAAVDEWIVSGKKFHVMRDHPAHSNYPISGGMWGGTREALPKLEELLKGKTIGDTYIEDMNFLNDVVWKIAQTSVFQHDSFSCKRFGGGHPFPTKRIGLEHVGSVFIDGEMRKVDTDILNNAKPPNKCTPN